MRPRVFRDPVHGLIRFEGEDVRLLDVLDTRPFQRLRRIRQDGFASLVYPGAEHSRFGHALGAFHVADRVTRALGLDAELARTVRVAALAHDLGHGPYSHAWEEAQGGMSHEAWGARILAEDDELLTALSAVEPGLAPAVRALLRPGFRPAYARKLVSSQLDVDRMDYLLRDAHYAGVTYSAYDLDWIIHALRVARVREGDDPFDLVVEHRAGMHSLLQFLFGRYTMYAQVYYHKTVRAAETLLTSTMTRFAELARAGREPAGLPAAAAMARGERISVAAYLGLDDARVQCALDDWAGVGDGRGTDDPVLADLARRLVTRRLFKTVEIGDDPGRAEELRPRLEALARARFGEHARFYAVIDSAEGLGYDPRPGEEIFVVGHPRLGTVDLGRLVRDLSPDHPGVAPLSRVMFTVRIICAPELVGDVRALVAAP